MSRPTSNNQGANPIVSQTGIKGNTYDDIKRAYERAYADGNDYTQELINLAQVVAYSVINTCIDPRRKTAPEHDTTSNSGVNPAMVDIKRGIGHDMRLLDSVRRNADEATHITHNADGDTVTATNDADAYRALLSVVRDTLTDGIDLVQTAALALLEQAADHADGDNWLDMPYTVRRLSRRVYIQRTDSAAYRDVGTTPIQEVYRAVRKTVQDSRAVQTDPRNGYSYIEDMTADGLDTIYYRLHRYADLGGYNSDGQYTTSMQSVQDYDNVISRLNLTDRQAQVLSLRMQGKGYKAIATYLGVCNNAVVKTVKQIRNKAMAIGLSSPRPDDGDTQ